MGRAAQKTAQLACHLIPLALSPAHPCPPTPPPPTPSPSASGRHPRGASSRAAAANPSVAAAERTLGGGAARSGCGKPAGGGRYASAKRGKPRGRDLNASADWGRLGAGARPWRPRRGHGARAMAARHLGLAAGGGQAQAASWRWQRRCAASSRQARGGTAAATGATRKHSKISSKGQAGKHQG